MKLSMILARSDDNVIGVDNKLPWDCPPDLMNFKAITSKPNTAIVMGRNTWNSLPVRPLPGRINIIVTSNPDNLTPVEMADMAKHGLTVVWAPNIEDCIKYSKEMGLEELFFIGGKQIYEAVKDIVDEVHLSQINIHVGDTDGEKVIFDHEFEWWSWCDPLNVDWEVVTSWPCLDEDGKLMFEYFHIRRKSASAVVSNS